MSELIVTPRRSPRKRGAAPLLSITGAPLPSPSPRPASTPTPSVVPEIAAADPSIIAVPIARSVSEAGQRQEATASSTIHPDPTNPSVSGVDQRRDAMASSSVNAPNSPSNLTLPMTVPHPYHPSGGAPMGQMDSQTLAQGSAPPALHPANSFFYPPYSYQQHPVGGQWQGQSGFPHSNANQWPYGVHPYFYTPGVSGAGFGGAHATAAPPKPPPSTSNAPAPPQAEAAFGIDPARLAAPPPYASSATTASQSSGAPTAAIIPPTVTPTAAPTSLNDTSAPTTTALENAPVANNDDSDGNEEARSARKRNRGDDTSDEDSDSDESDKETGRSGKSKKRQVASKSNPLFGHIIGAGTGAMKTTEEQEEHDMVIRTRELPSPYVLQTAATRHYRRNVPEILTRVESIASRTGCYAYIALQHPESGSNFYYYASKKIREEAPTDIKEIHRKVGDTMSKLLKAHKSMKVTLQSDLQSAQAKAALAERKAAEAEQKAKLLEEQLALLRAASAEI